MEDSTLRNEVDIIDWIETINLTTVVDLTGNAGEWKNTGWTQWNVGTLTLNPKMSSSIYPLQAGKNKSHEL